MGLLFKRAINSGVKLVWWVASYDNPPLWTSICMQPTFFIVSALYLLRQSKGAVYNLAYRVFYAIRYHTNAYLVVLKIV